MVDWWVGWASELVESPVGWMSELVGRVDE